VSALRVGLAGVAFGLSALRKTTARSFDPR
jgi:hypothetical protein